MGWLSTGQDSSVCSPCSFRYRASGHLVTLQTCSPGTLELQPDPLTSELVCRAWLPRGPLALCTPGPLLQIVWPLQLPVQMLSVANGPRAVLAQAGQRSAPQRSGSSSAQESRPHSPLRPESGWGRSPSKIILALALSLGPRALPSLHKSFITSETSS